MARKDSDACDLYKKTNGQPGMFFCSNSSEASAVVADEEDGFQYGKVKEDIIHSQITSFKGKVIDERDLFPRRKHATKDSHIFLRQCREQFDNFVENDSAKNLNKPKKTLRERNTVLVQFMKKDNKSDEKKERSPLPRKLSNDGTPSSGRSRKKTRNQVVDLDEVANKLNNFYNVPTAKRELYTYRPNATFEPLTNNVGFMSTRADFPALI